MTALRFYLNDDGDHEYYDTIHYRSIVPVVLRCSTTNLIPFCTHYESTGESISDVIVEYFDGGELTLDDTSMFEVLTDDTWDWIVYYGGEVESGGSDIDPGLVRLRIELSDSNILYSDYFEVCELTTEYLSSRIIYSDYFNLWFACRYDLTDPYRILYQTDYENHHAFDTLPVRPDVNLSTNGYTDECHTEFDNYNSLKKTYQIEIIGSESLFDMLAVLPLHEYIYVYWPEEGFMQARNVEFEYDWVDDYLCRMTVKFSIENLKKGSCDTDFEL